MTPTKAQRRRALVRALSEHRVTSQAQLCEILARRGIATTQATISRDLDDLGAYRARGESGELVYVLPPLDGGPRRSDDALERAVADHVIEADRSGDLLVLRTPPGHAHVVGSAIDRARLGDVLGTVAGDDTLLVVAREGRGRAVLASLTKEKP